MDDAIRAKIFEDFKHMITTESVVGQPIYLGDATIVPFVDISFGFGSGHCSNGTREGGAGGGKMTPTAVLIMKGERIELFSIKNATANNTIDKVINMVPEVIAISAVIMRRMKKRQLGMIQRQPFRLRKKLCRRP